MLHNTVGPTEVITSTTVLYRDSATELTRQKSSMVHFTCGASFFYVVYGHLSPALIEYIFTPIQIKS